MFGYSPFEKRMEALVASDLSALRTVHEGWYVEYKREVIQTAAIAKSLAAFANTFGGWTFYGIHEKSKDEPVAGVFTGIALHDVDSTLQRIRQAAATYLAPTPFYSTKVLAGPCELIGLEADRAIIAVNVPWGPQAPYVHKSGQIYRRVGDSSDPKPENDRFVLDQLWRRSDDINKSYKRWIKRDPEFSKAERKKPFVRILLVTDLWGDQGIHKDYSAREFREIVGQKTAPQTAIPFDFVATSENSLIARQFAPNRPQDVTLQWRYWNDASSEIIIPLNSYEGALNRLSNSLDGYTQWERFVTLLQQQHFKDAHIADLNQLFNILCGAINIQDRLCENANWKGPYYGKVRLLNFWRMTPFLDVSVILDHFEKFGVPIVGRNTLTMLPGFEPGTFFEIGAYANVDDVNARVILKALVLFRSIATALGVPPWYEFDNDEADRAFFRELQDAGVRANTLQARRAD